jgi:hypothetical protein
MFAFILVLFLPNMMDGVDQIWGKMGTMSAQDQWGNTDLNLTFTDWIRRNMMVFTLGIIALTGIITYAKFKLTSGQY